MKLRCLPWGTCLYSWYSYIDWSLMLLLQIATRTQILHRKMQWECNSSYYERKGVEIVYVHTYMFMCRILEKKEKGKKVLTHTHTHTYINSLTLYKTRGEKIFEIHKFSSNAKNNEKRMTQIFILFCNQDSQGERERERLTWVHSIKHTWNEKKYNNDSSSSRMACKANHSTDTTKIAVVAGNSTQIIYEWNLFSLNR